MQISQLESRNNSKKSYKSTQMNNANFKAAEISPRDVQKQLYGDIVKLTSKQTKLDEIKRRFSGVPSVVVAVDEALSKLDPIVAKTCQDLVASVGKFGRQYVHNSTTKA